MDELTTLPQTPAIRLVDKPKSNWSGMLNGAGNGLMIGGIGLTAYNLKNNFKSSEMKSPTFLILAGVTGIATVIGGVYGLNESRQINTYRAALAKDIETLHAQVDAIDPKITPAR